MALIGTYLAKAVENKDDMIPWSTLRYLIGDAMYGGRVSDSFDRRILTTYLEEFLGDFLFDAFQPFHFFHDEHTDYCVPEHGPKQNYTRVIDVLPTVQSPEIFGLNPNADVSYYTIATKTLWQSLIELQPRVGGLGGGISREEHIDNVAKDIISKIPEPFDTIVVKKGIPEPSPTQVVLLQVCLPRGSEFCSCFSLSSSSSSSSSLFFLLVPFPSHIIHTHIHTCIRTHPTTHFSLPRSQELDRWNALIRKMKASLKMLRKALSGEIGMSADMEQLSNALFDGQLPAMWKKLTPETQKMLGSWIMWFQKRYNQYKSWVENGEPKVMWLSGLHIPETFLAALVQAACRSRGWPLDKSTLYTKVRCFRKEKKRKEKKIVIFCEGECDYITERA